MTRNGKISIYLMGDCTNEDLINDIFGDVTLFAQHIEEWGDNSVFRNVVVTYNEKTDIHSFYQMIP